MAEMQKTLATEVSLEGVGLHTGRKVKMTLKPAPEDNWFSFKRIDLEGAPVIEANAIYVQSTERGTVLESKGVKIHTTEHVLAALVGMDLDNVIIELDGPEPPIMDGSSKLFVEAIEKAGILEQSKERAYYEIKENVSYTDENTGSEINIIPSKGYQITAMVDFGTQVLGTQNAFLNSLQDFKKEVSDCRTFCFLHELEMLLDAGLIKGGDLNNAIVYVDREISKETMAKLKKVFNKENIQVNANGVLDNLELNYPNEAARHKLLDIVGDLALIGVRIKGKVFASKPGHFVNTQLAKKIAKQIKLEKRKCIPKFDLNTVVMDIHQIMDMLPHRPPFLLVDKIIELEASKVVGVKNVTMNEPFFVGHFPGAPVMPGVLQIEAMAQVGGILVLSTVPDPENYLTYFMKMDKVKFKQKVLPGDTVIFKAELITPIRRGICHMQGYGYVGDKIVCEAQLMAQISKVK